MLPKGQREVRWSELTFQAVEQHHREGSLADVEVDCWALTLLFLDFKAPLANLFLCAMLETIQIRLSAVRA